jgi:hypothetical protein
MTSGMFRNLFVDNPVLVHAARRGRKYIRGTGQRANYAVAVIIPVSYALVVATLMVRANDWMLLLQYAELIAVTLIIPMATYAAIAGERERASWEALVVTRLTLGQILAGHILWRLLLIAGIMVLFGLPISAATFGLIPTGAPEAYSDSGSWTSSGGYLVGAYAVSSPVILPLEEQVGGQALIFFWALLLCGFSLNISASFQRSAASAGATFGVILGALLFLPILLSMFGAGGSFWLNSALMIFNPFHALPLPDMLGGRSYSSGYSGSYGMRQDFEFYPIIMSVYLIGAVWFTYMAHLRLRRWKIGKNGAISSWQAP